MAFHSKSTGGLRLPGPPKSPRPTFEPGEPQKRTLRMLKRAPRGGKKHLNVGGDSDSSSEKSEEDEEDEELPGREWTLEQLTDESLQEYVRHLWKTRRPQGLMVDYDWWPFLRAVYESTSTLRLPPPRDESGDAPLLPREHRHNPVPQTQANRVPKGANSGAWDYVWYIPEWSHPDFSPDAVVDYVGRRTFTRTKDPIFKHVPALRAADQVRNPTPWARRFGIHADELGGRSRLSPTMSATRTRDPLLDFQSQLAVLTDEQRAELRQASRQAARAAGGADPADPEYVDPRALAEMMARLGYLSPDRFEAMLRNAAVLPEVPLDILFLVAKANWPKEVAAHRNLFARALADQNYQRLYFRNFTSDELVQYGALTMSDDVTCDLQGPLHPLLQRSRWDDSLWKGDESSRPRFVYNLNGMRGEWDAARNDVVWEALQPALQMVSRILYSNPPGLEALMDMRTRRPAPAEDDWRKDPETPFVPIYTLMDKIDMDKTFEGIRFLASMGYDWRANTMRMLEQTLRLDLCSAFLNPEESDDEDDNEKMFPAAYSFHFGITKMTRLGRDSYITCNLAIELIWPLLVPEYSQSEKLTVSFLIASTLIHELAHAVNDAHNALTTEMWAQPLGQNPEITEALLKLGHELWDFTNLMSEPIFEGMPTQESGFDVEKSLWGFIAVNLLSTADGHSRHMVCSPLVLLASSWPRVKFPGSKGILGGTAHPGFIHSTLIPISYLARFFQQRFWDTEFKTYGHEALKFPHNSDSVKSSILPDWLPPRARIIFGDTEHAWMTFVVDVLLSNNYTSIASYLHALSTEIAQVDAFDLRWRHETATWGNRTLFPLSGALVELSELETESTDLEMFSQASVENKMNIYQGYLNATQKNPMEYPAWEAWVGSQWDEMYRDGGSLMRCLKRTMSFVVQDIAYMERMIFDFLALDMTSRSYFYGLEARKNYIGMAQARIMRFYNDITWIVEFIQAISLRPAMRPILTQWQRWEKTYRACSVRYRMLIDMLDHQDQLQPDDLRWRRRFPSISSASLRSRVQRTRDLAKHEYARLDPRIREVVDDYEVFARQAKEAVGLPPPLSGEQEDTGVDHVQRVLEEAWKAHGIIDPSIDPGPGLFTLKPATKGASRRQSQSLARPKSSLESWSASGLAGRWARRLSKNPPVQSSGGKDDRRDSNVVFGWTSRLNPPRSVWRRHVRRGSGRVPVGSSGSGMGSGGRRPSPAPAGPTRGGRVERRARPWARYANIGADEVGSAFLRGAQKVGALEEIARLGVPGSTIAELLAQGSFGGGTPFSRVGPQFGAAVGEPAKGAFPQPPPPESWGLRMFPNGYSTVDTLTSDIEAHNINQVAARILGGVWLGGDGAPLYQSSEPYREPARRRSSVDLSEEESGRPFGLLPLALRDLDPTDWIDES
ncbi:hypothetical protein GGS23DRAFT_611513 [Durotheca rogersii]|uniref:uncharacterized protein n=1 Tax=Durotheca rogersii TaxID=419775 RepID=UPI0022201DF9|nr:uncharacterized protein GGS23DRAFT_611513 [Durotheca rogersii]KAI5861523.1 hypothetical protein GGS23DRAFT_611513 [Durotheca rogersii]